MRSTGIYIALAVITGTASFWNAARAFPDGAPWGAANPDAEQNCATCHFGADPVRDSKVLAIDGLPTQPAPGTVYELNIVLEDPDAVIAGFQLFAQAVNQQEGTFVSSIADVEFIGAAIQSVAPTSRNENVSWVVEWHAPDVIGLPIVFYVAASAANDDGSPFGDTIHFRKYTITAH